MANSLNDPRGFLKTLFDLISKISSENKKDASFVSELSDSKMEELHQVHEIFVGWIGDVERELQIIVASFDRIADQKPASTMVELLSRLYNKLEADRGQSRAQRRSDYEEARTYKDATFDKKIIKSLPEEVVNKLRSFMSSYCRYFENNQRYEHDVSHVIRQLKYSVEFLENILQNEGSLKGHEKKNFRELLIKFVDFADASTANSHEKWATVSRRYHELKLGPIYVRDLW